VHQNPCCLRVLHDESEVKASADLETGTDLTLDKGAHPAFGVAYDLDPFYLRVFRQMFG
jgi:hypothetical protein